jgi:hypothetical protein
MHPAPITVQYNHFLCSLKFIARRFVASIPPDFYLYGIFDDLGARDKCEESIAMWVRQLSWALDNRALCVTEISHFKKRGGWEHEYIAIHVKYKNPKDHQVYEMVIYADRNFSHRAETKCDENEVPHQLGPTSQNLYSLSIDTQHWRPA